MKIMNMRQQIRYNVFETNSSSEHSLSIVKHKCTNKRDIPRDSVWNYDPENFPLLCECFEDKNYSIKQNDELFDDLAFFGSLFVTEQDKFNVMMQLCMSYLNEFKSGNDEDYLRSFYSVYEDEFPESEDDENENDENIPTFNEFFAMYEPVSWLIEMVKDECNTDVKLLGHEYIESLDDRTLIIQFTNRIKAKFDKENNEDFWDEFWNNKETFKEIMKNIVFDKNIGIVDDGYGR